MSKVYTGASMSIDGYISGPEFSGFEHLFAWYTNGDVEIPNEIHPELSQRVTDVSAEHLRTILGMSGAIVCGRTLWDLTKAWGGTHPMGVPVVVLTHSVPDGWEREGEWFTFVTEGGIGAAVAKAKELAGDKGVALNGGEIASQALDAGLVDEVWVDLVPVILGAGTPFFGNLANRPVVLEGPLSIGAGKAVTHLRYRVTAR
ncbi:dihydrofolate reductase family protein [Virgisporangium ochraceum]|uniref:Deaminase n=1 Tax=Virgisporangium ochraceum TaxID=65505 RepID=A0A8J3ZYB5_9ACTN|nr:dihydrofolate reductase family protein [Virgisporangium ochraceum]GIJ69710.1 deaminase [Virgisporangium ochraceum]